MNHLEQLMEITRKINEILSDPKADIEYKISEFEILVQKREEIITQIENINFLDFSKEYIKEFSELDKSNQLLANGILSKINSNLNKLKEEKKEANTKKKANRGYLKSGIQSEGYFIDGKK
jgi:hypothetical protein